MQSGMQCIHEVIIQEGSKTPIPTEQNPTTFTNMSTKDAGSTPTVKISSGKKSVLIISHRRVKTKVYT
jgi:hypothetical protein